LRDKAQKGVETELAHGARDQRYLGIDTKVLVAYLDAEHPQHSKTTGLAKVRVAVNPTVIHEAYHALVFKMGWTPEEAKSVLDDMLASDNVLFLNQTLTVTRDGLELAVKHSLGGRDALIAASYLSREVRKVISFDEDLLRIGTIKYGDRVLTISPP